MDMILVKLIFIFAFNPMALGDTQIGKPIFKQFMSTFPGSYLVIILDPPVDANGHIFQYYISISWGNRLKDCIYWKYMCESCMSNKELGNKGKRQELCSDNGGIQEYPKNSDKDRIMNQIQVHVIHESKVRPYTNYTLMAQGRNIWGFGKLLITSFTTTQYKSSAPKIGNWIYSKGRLVGISFSPPVDRNGKISEYRLIMKNPEKDLCIKWIVTCTDCGNENVQNGNPNISTTDCVKITKHLYANFESKSTNITLKSIYIDISNTTYKIEIQARNKWGWGNIGKAEKTTMLNDNSKEQNNSKEHSVLDDMNNYKYFIIVGIGTVIICILLIIIIKNNICKPNSFIIRQTRPANPWNTSISINSSSMPRPKTPNNQDNSTNHSISNDSSSMMRPSRPTTGPHLIANNNSSMARPIPHLIQDNSGNLFLSNDTSSMARQTKIISRNNSANQMMANELGYIMKPLEPNNRDNSAFHSINNNEPDYKEYNNMYNLKDAENFYTNSAPIVPPRLNAPANIEPTNKESYGKIYGAGKVPRHNNKSAFTMV